QDSQPRAFQPGNLAEQYEPQLQVALGAGDVGVHERAARAGPPVYRVGLAVKEPGVRLGQDGGRLLAGGGHYRLLLPPGHGTRGDLSAGEERAVRYWGL